MKTESGKCKFDKAWIGRCNKPTIEGTDYCQEHSKEKCCSCGAQATHTCPETGQFVCGFPLCDDCEHTIFPDGTNGGIGFNAQSLPAGMKLHNRKPDRQAKPSIACECHPIQDEPKSITYKTAELEGDDLDYAVAILQPTAVQLAKCMEKRYSPSTDWSQGGPIIEREQIAIFPTADKTWRAQIGYGIYGIQKWGPTHLIAAMRCYVAAKLGENVTVP